MSSNFSQRDLCGESTWVTPIEVVKGLPFSPRGGDKSIVEITSQHLFSFSWTSTTSSSTTTTNTATEYHSSRTSHFRRLCSWTDFGDLNEYRQKPPGRYSILKDHHRAKHNVFCSGRFSFSGNQHCADSQSKLVFVSLRPSSMKTKNYTDHLSINGINSMRRINVLNKIRSSYSEKSWSLPSVWLFSLSLSSLFSSRSP